MICFYNVLLRTLLSTTKKLQRTEMLLAIKTDIHFVILYFQSILAFCPYLSEVFQVFM